jgi:hypothetical protein
VLRRQTSTLSPSTLKHDYKVLVDQYLNARLEGAGQPVPLTPTPTLSVEVSDVGKTYPNQAERRENAA